MGQKIRQKLRKGVFVSTFGVVLVVALLVQSEISQWLKVFTALAGLIMMLSALICWNMLQMNPSDSHSIPSLVIHYLITKIFTKMGKKLVNGYRENAKNLVSQQEELLMNVLKTNCNSVYGKDLGFNDIRSATEFRERHPVVGYDQYESYVQRIINGESNIMTDDRSNKITRLVTTSGTTGKRKSIPHSSMFAKEGIKIAQLSFYVPVLKGVQENLQKQFFMYTHMPKRTLACGLEVGPYLSFVYKHFPYFSYPKEVVDIQNEEVAMYVHGVFLLREREIGSMTFIMVIQAFNFFKYLEQNWENLCDDIEHGTISVSYEKDTEIDDILQKLTTYLEPNYDRAVKLREEKKKGITGLAHRLWPDLLHIKACCTGSMAVYKELLEEGFLKDILLISYFYGGTEGFFGLNISPDMDDLCYTLAYTFGFFEFIPVEHISGTKEELKEHILLAHQVQVGNVYELVVTNINGLYRYRTGDMVKVTYFTHQCPVFEYMYRTGEVLNIMSERTAADTMYDALKKVTRSLNVGLIDYTACEDVYFMEQDHDTSYKRRYILFIELSRKLSEEEADQFDNTLCEMTQQYNWYRHTKKALDPVKVLQVEDGSFLKLKQRMTSEQHNSVQFKMPRTLRNKAHLEFLKQFVVDN